MPTPGSPHTPLTGHVNREPPPPMYSLLIIGLIFHAIYTYSIFDIYFTSPVVHGMPPSVPKSTQPPPARRVVLIVADGLRADTLYSHRDWAPCLHSIMESQGSWGVSHTRVPTESRPGHVAILAGMYEDVSAVTKGWKMNPVNFDSMVNASSSSFLFGSPDILPMFVEGAADDASNSRISAHMYSSSLEDFASTHNITALDLWVFDQFKQLLDSPNTQLDQPHVFIFLHLLGLDTNGHAFGPHSPQYTENLQLVDRNLDMVIKAMDRRFPDKKTAYVFTSDHGMHARGNHGDGDPQNTLTPFVAWGAGIRLPLRNETPSHIINPNGTSGHPHTYPGVDTLNWPTNSMRRDVNQADIAALMAALLGTRFPFNNVGILPRDLLDDPVWARDTARANTFQILHMYRTKATIRRIREPNYVPFRSISVLEHVPDFDLAKVVDYYYKGFEGLDRLINDCLLGLDYLQTYDWLFLRTVVTLGYIGWMAYALSHVIYLNPPPPTANETNGFHPFISIFTIPIAFLLSVYLYVKEAPVTYHMYTVLAVYLWDATLRRIARYSNQIVSPGRQTILASLAYAMSLEMLIFSYHNRWVLFPVSVALSMRPWASQTQLSGNEPSPRLGGWRAVWSISSLICGTFTLLPIVGQETQLGQFAMGLILLFTLGTLTIIRSYKHGKLMWKRHTIQLTLSVAAAINVFWIVSSLSSKAGLPPIAQVASWCILIASPLTHSQRFAPALLRQPASSSKLFDHITLTNLIDLIISLALALAPIYVLLSTAYELAFVVCYTVACISWAAMECDLAQRAPGLDTQSNTPGDMAAAFTYLFLIHLGFFGTGNIASLSSFTLSSVYRLVTVFSPFTMGALLILKVVLPFVISSASFRVVALARTLSLTQFVKSGVAPIQIKDPFTLFILVVATCDVLTVHFFWQVRDQGSWLEIGTSISHFGIASSFLVVLFVLYAVCGVALGRVLVPRVKLD